MGGMTFEHDDMLRLAEHIEKRGEYADLDDATRNQFRASTSNAMREIFNSDDHHQWGHRDDAHAALLVAGNHISAAGKMMDQSGNTVDSGMAVSPKDHAEKIATRYKKTYRS